MGSDNPTKDSSPPSSESTSVHVEGDVSGQVAVGESIVQISDVRGGEVTIGTKIVYEAPRPALSPYQPPPLPDLDSLPEPGKLPPGSRLTFHRNELFTGRTQPLKDLARALLHDGAGSTLVTQAVQGMGGVGKTQLAVEFAYRYGRYFHGVHWINARQPEGIGAEVAACGQAMSFPNWPAEQPEQISRTLSEWQQGGACLDVDVRQAQCGVVERGPEAEHPRPARLGWLWSVAGQRAVEGGCGGGARQGPGAGGAA